MTLSLPCWLATNSPVIATPERKLAHHSVCGRSDCGCPCGHPGRTDDPPPRTRNPGRTDNDKPITTPPAGAR